jgi:hypothetical protein
MVCLEMLRVSLSETLQISEIESPPFAFSSELRKGLECYKLLCQVPLSLLDLKSFVT